MKHKVLQLMLKDGFLAGTYTWLTKEEIKTSERRIKYKIDNFAFPAALGPGQFFALKNTADAEAVKQMWLGWFLNRYEERKCSL